MTAGSCSASFPIKQPGSRVELTLLDPAILESNTSCLAGWLCAPWASSLGSEPQFLLQKKWEQCLSRALLRRKENAQGLA